MYGIFTVVVPPDVVAHIDADLGDAALKMMKGTTSAEIVPAAECKIVHLSKLTASRCSWLRVDRHAYL